ETQSYEEAIDYYERALRHSTNNEQGAKIYYWMAEAAIQQEKYAQAREDYLNLANDYPKTSWAPKALYARGRLFLRESKFDSSAVAFELLKERYPNNKITRRIGTALGESYYQQNK